MGSPLNRRRRARAWLASALAVLQAFLPLAVDAAIPQRINYQGKLGDASGNPHNGTYSFRFELYSTETGGSPLFTEDVTGAANAISVVNGIYSVQIGSLTAGGIPLNALSNQDTWLQLSVKAGTDLTGAEILSPREKLASTAYAIRALSSENLGYGAVLATFTAAGLMRFPYEVQAGSMNLTGGIIASSGTFSASGPTQYSVTTSSGLNVGAGPVYLNSGGYIRFPDGTMQMTAGSGGSFVSKAGDSMNADAALTFSGAGGTITSQSSVTASAFFGNGAGLSGIPSTASISAGYQPLDADLTDLADGVLSG
ncbi:MAG: hypothetical protein HY403_04140, partial [Elusimicrobia bacterium]|nr:hypothetical protein [Elusimicrobiota bacterium]